LNPAKITVFAGHYGGGKTTAAVSYALHLAKTRPNVALCDMDVVNPYFRSADAAPLLARGGVELISSPYANSNVEMPWAPAQALRIFDDPGLTGVVDLGGDDCGALAIGRYARRLNGRGDADLWMVINPYRPLTRDIEGLRAIRGEIETAARLRFTGLVNNANLGAQTTRETIEARFDFMRGASEALALPVAITCVMRGIEIDVPPELGEKLLIERWENRFGVCI
jgi:hypothetical protein